MSVGEARRPSAEALACYGNKYRKFEYIIPDILDQKRKHGRKVAMLVTEGAIQSNHTVQVTSAWTQMFCTFA